MGFIIKIKQDADTFTLDGKTYDTVTFSNLGGTTSTTTIKAKLYGSKITNDASFIEIGNTGNYTLIDDFMVGGTGDLIFKNQDTTVDFTNYPSMVIAYSPIANDYSVAVKGWGKNKNLTTISKAGNGFILVHKLFKSTVTGLDDELHLRFGTCKNITYYYKIFAKYAVQPNESSLLGFDYGQSYSILNTSSSNSTQILTFPSKTDAEDKSFTTSTENQAKYECIGFQEIDTSGNLIGSVYNCGAQISISGNTNSSAARTFIALYSKVGTDCIIKFHYQPQNTNIYVKEKTVTLDLSTGNKNVTLSDYDNDFIGDFSNHKFKGWSSKSLVNIEITSVTFSTTKTSIDVYAMWEVTHTATLILDLSGEGIIREAGVSNKPNTTINDTKTFTYGEYTNQNNRHEFAISIKNDMNLTESSFTKTGYEFLNYTGVTPILANKTGSVSFSFLPYDTLSQSITLTPTWAQLYTLILKYDIGTLVGGDSIDDFPFPRTVTLYSSTSTIRTISSSLSNITPTTSKEYNIFRYYSIAESPVGGTLTIANNPMANTTFSYKFPTNTKTVTITFTALWQSQYIFTVNFYKNSTSASGTSPVTKVEKELKALTNLPASYTLSIPIEYGETPFGFSRTDYEVTAWSKSTGGSNPITDEEITWEFKTSDTTYGKTINLYAVWEEAGYAWIYTSAGWKKAQPWIYCQIGSETTPSWHKARPWIFDGTEWKHT